MQGERPGEEVMVPCPRCRDFEHLNPECPVCLGALGILPSAAPWPEEVRGLEEFIELRAAFSRFGIDGFRVMAERDPSPAFLTACAIFDAEVDRLWSEHEGKVAARMAKRRKK